jgi:hypothetical protein
MNAFPPQPDGAVKDRIVGGDGAGQLTILGQHPFAKREDGSLISRIATLFVKNRVLVTVPGVHAVQRLEYTKYLNQLRAQRGLPPLSHEEEIAEWNTGVDLIIDDGTILIRAEPGQMDLAFEADEILQEIVSKSRIRFLHARDDRIKQAIRKRGEYWRVALPPQSPEAIIEMIKRSMISIGGRAIYYYNMITGTRYLTYHQFEKLGEIQDDNELWQHLEEIRKYFRHPNRFGYFELDFFGVEDRFTRKELEECFSSEAGPATARKCYAEIQKRFKNAVKPELRVDNPYEPEWRSMLFVELIRHKDETTVEEVLQELTPEFFMQIQWLPGAYIEEGELIFDPIFDELDKYPDDPLLREICDERVKGFISNYVREFFGNLEHVNIGRIIPTIRRKSNTAPYRSYIAEIKVKDSPQPVVRIIRFQKWGISEHLDEGKDLLRSIMEAEEYTDYILERRLGCWQLGMQLPPKISVCRLPEVYRGTNRYYHGTRIWTTYFERDFIKGIATDKVPPAMLEEEDFANCFAWLLGGAAAPNLIVGRATLSGEPIFDDGDEILVLDAQRMPQQIVAADHAGTFNSYDSNLLDFAEYYSKPVISRIPSLSNPNAFMEAYLDGFIEKLAWMQAEYRKRRRAFDTLFKHSKQDVGSFGWRWKAVLARLECLDIAELITRIREHIQPYIK